MLHQNQDTKRLNTTEVILPTETIQEGVDADPVTMPASPIGLNFARRWLKFLVQGKRNLHHRASTQTPL
jgi:hypothetical protein